MGDVVFSVSCWTIVAGVFWALVSALAIVGCVVVMNRVDCASPLARAFHAGLFLILAGGLCLLLLAVAFGV